MEPKILEEIPVSMSELKAEIDNIKKRSKEPTIRVTKVEEYLSAFKVPSPAKDKELREKLRKLDIPRLKEDHIIKIIDLMPKTVDDLKMVMQGYVISISNDNLKKIVDTVN